MAKWVTFLLLLLAVLSYGLSQMRPAPPPEVTTMATATPEVAGTPEPVAETPGPAQGTPPATTGRAPHFGLPGQTGSTPDSAPATPATTPAPEPVPGTIKAAVFSTSPDGGSRTKFTPDTASIYITATPERLDDKVDVVASYRSMAGEDAPFSTPVDSSGPPRRRIFRLTPPEGGWQKGPYQAVFKVKGSDQVLGFERFEIEPEESIPVGLPSPEFLNLVPDAQTDESRNRFKSQDKLILLRVGAHELPSGTPIRAVWSALEVDDLTAGELIGVHTEPAPGPDRDAAFKLEPPPGGFHTGSYKVDLYFDQELAGSHVFFIDPPARATGDK